jgi:hypothetical protein
VFVGIGSVEERCVVASSVVAVLIIDGDGDRLVTVKAFVVFPQEEINKHNSMARRRK